MKLLSALRRLFESAEQRKARLRDEAKKARRAEQEAKGAKRKAKRDMKLASRAQIREQKKESVKTERSGEAVVGGVGSVEVCRLCGVKMESNSASIGVRLMQAGQVDRLMALATVCRSSGHIQCTGCAHRAGGRCPSCHGDIQPYAFGEPVRASSAAALAATSHSSATPTSLLGKQYYLNGRHVGDCAACGATVYPESLSAVNSALMARTFGIVDFKPMNTARWCSKCDDVYCGSCGFNSSWVGPSSPSQHSALPAWWIQGCPRCGTRFDVFTEESIQ